MRAKSPYHISMTNNFLSTAAIENLESLYRAEFQRELANQDVGVVRKQFHRPFSTKAATYDS